MPANMRRCSTAGKMTIASGAATSSHIACGDWAIGSIHMDAMTQATFSYETADDVDSTGAPTNWGAANDYAGVAIGNIAIVDSTVVPIDPKVFTARFFRIVVGGGNEGADRTLTVQLKG